MPSKVCVRASQGRQRGRDEGPQKQRLCAEARVRRAEGRQRRYDNTDSNTTNDHNTTTATTTTTTTNDSNNDR